MARTIAKDHNEKRIQILKVSARKFATEGFDRASVSELAKECGISKANIYHYYSGKDEILFEILDTYLTVLREKICSIDLSGMSPQDALRATVEETLLAYQGADHEHRIQSAGLSVLPESQQKILRGYQLDIVQHVEGILEKAAPDAFKDEPSKLRATTMSVFGMLNWYYMWSPGAGTQARKDYAKLVSDLTLGGVTKL